MQFTTLALFGLAGFAAAASNSTAAPVAANNGTAAAAPAVVYVTDVLTAYTTYCPFATQVTQNGVVYTATASQTLTITDCPCTVTKAVTQQTASMTPSAPAAAQTSAASNGSAPYKPQAFTGAGNKVAAGGSLLAVGAAAVLLL
ncbi:hypothetical protein MBLNU457_1984t1 [Dothideomycetes sp. NU457]